MYSVSQDYITKAFNISKKRRAISAFLDDVAFNENDVVANSLKYTLQCVGGAEIRLGGIFLGQLFLTFTKPFAAQIARGSWIGKKITLSIGLEIGIEDDLPVVEYVPIGEFYIEEANHVENGVEITAYDAMRKFDKNLPVTSTSGDLYSMIDFACTKCGVTLGMTRAEIEALPNGEETFSIYPDNDMKYFRDLLSWVAVTMGGYATINRDGELELRGWNSEPVISMGVNDRFAKGSFSDFRTYYTGISVTNIAEQTTSYYHTEVDDGLTMNIGANPLLQYGLLETKQRQRMAILNALSNFDYVPFKCSAFADVFFDLGDVITFTDGLAGTSSKCCVMRIDFSFSKGVTLQGFGKNPALFGAQSKTDKNIAGLMSQNKENEVKYVVYTNVEDMTIPAWETGSIPLASLRLSSVKEGWIEVNTTFFFDLKSTIALSSSATVGRMFRGILMFKLDGEEIAFFQDNRFFFSKKDTDYSMTLEHYFAFRMGENETKILTVELGNQFLWVYAGGTGTARLDDNNGSQMYVWANGLNIYVKGQALASEASWDGIITLEDVIQEHTIGSLGIQDIEDSAVVSLQEIIPVQATDAIPLQEIAGMSIVDIDEQINITMARPTFNTVDETGEFNLVTEDGLYNLTTE